MWDEVGYIASSNSMLIGEHKHTLDDKNRLSLPAKFRKELGKKIVITRGLDKCLFVYPMKEWDKVAQNLRESSTTQSDSRAFNRFLLGGAVDIELDGSGRVLIPEVLKNFATLGTRVVVVGVNNRVELWNEDMWNAYTARVESQAESLAEKLTTIGMM